jgi:AcrR family transcriptional regulator
MLSGSLYHHFPSKEAILLELLEEFFDGALARYRRPAGAGGDPVARLHDLVRVSLEFTLEYPELTRVVVGESQRLVRSARLGWLGDRTSRMAAVWSEVIADGVRQGRLRGDLDPSALALMTQAAAWGMAGWFRADGRYSPDEAAHRFVGIFVDGLAGPARRPPRPLPELLGRTWRGGTRFLDPARIPDLESSAKALMAELPADADAATRIRAVAGLLFARQGYAATTVRRIADLAEVPVGSLAHHIGSKETLLTDMLNAFWGGLREAFERDAGAGPGPLRRVEGLIARTVEVFDGRGIASALILNELPSGTPGSGPAQVGRIWTDAIEAGVASGDLRADLDPGFTQRVIRSAIAGAGATYRAVGTADVAGLYQECLLTGVGRAAGGRAGG